MSVTSDNQATTGDVVDLLLEQHEEARRLFAHLQGGDGRRDTFDCLVRLLAVHETAEEEVVYPALRRLGPEGERAAEAGKAEEDEAKTLLSAGEGRCRRRGLRGPAGDGSLGRAPPRRAEEREVFPLLRQSMDPDTLRSVRNPPEAAEAMAPTHTHPHGPESAIGNMIVGPFVAVVDKNALHRGKAS